MKRKFIKKLPKNTKFYKKYLYYDLYYNDKYKYYVSTDNNEKIIERIKRKEEDDILLMNN